MNKFGKYVLISVVKLFIFKLTKKMQLKLDGVAP